jgi:enoyl-CoA hydratase/carnithine racemase
VQNLAAMPLGVLSAVKRLLAHSPNASLQQQLDMEADQVSRLAASPATLSVLEAFLSRRKG